MSEIPPSPFWSTPLPLPNPPPPPTVLSDLPCRRCSYNLKTLASDALCPECGTPVALSTQGDRLRYSDPQWLRTLRIGTGCLMVGLLIPVILGPIPPWFIRSTGAGQFGLGQLASTFGNLAVLTGAWLISTPDPSQPGTQAAARWGRALRALACIEFAEILAIRLTIAFSIFPAHAYVSVVIFILSESLSALLHLALFRYVQILALRVPDTAQARHAILLAYGFCLTIGVRSALHLWIPTIPRVLFALGLWTPLWLSFGDLIVLVANILAAGFSYRFATTLKAEFQAAQMLWSNPPHGV